MRDRLSTKQQANILATHAFEWATVVFSESNLKGLFYNEQREQL